MNDWLAILAHVPGESSQSLSKNIIKKLNRCVGCAGNRSITTLQAIILIRLSLIISFPARTTQTSLLNGIISDPLIAHVIGRAAKEKRVRRSAHRRTPGDA